MGGLGLAVYWLSPMSWMLRSAAHMEFLHCGGLGLAVCWSSPMPWMLRSAAHMELLHSGDYSRAAGEAILQSLDIQSGDFFM